MRNALLVLLALFLTYTPLVRCQDDPNGVLFSPEQLDNLLAPIALYPDPLLAQVLLAATFPDQIDEASRVMRANADPNFIDSQPWDVSVKAVAHYAEVLFMMADKLDWTTSLGQAYVSQSTDVMASVQRLRAQAQSAGNLATSPDMQVVDDGGNIEIWPAQPQFLYVPVYDPAIVYYPRVGFVGGPIISFSAGFPIGVWLNFDFDWRGHRVFYHGWDHGGGWVARSRPFIHINNVYVNNNYRNVAVNRTVLSRRVNYASLNRYNAVHRDVNYGTVRVNNRFVNNGGPANVNNKILQRNVNANDQRIDQYRGHPAEQPKVNWTEVTRPQVNQPQVNRPASPAPQPQAQRTANPAFGASGGAFDARAASQRGQVSRQQMSQPAPAYRPPAPAPQRSAPPSAAPQGNRGGRR
jgi:hypothetical protein